MTKSFYISAGEVSGEQHAAKLVDALRRAVPTARFTGMGGDLLREAGVETLIDVQYRRVMGFVEVVRHIPFFKRALDSTVRHVLETGPDAVILVDYPGYHLRLARALRERMPDLPILYYIAPKVWAWNESRVERLRASVSKMLCIFPFEEAYFEERGVVAEYVGNPTMDAVRNTPDGTDLQRKLGMASFDRLVALFPGSRRSELKRLWPPLLGAAERLREFSDLAFAVALAPGYSVADLEAIRPVPEWIRSIDAPGREIMAAADLVLAKSGTTTLEAALLQRPMVAVYRANWLSAAIARRVVRVPYVTLPNIIANRAIVPELLQEDCAPEKIAREASMLLAIPERRQRQIADFAALRDHLGTSPAAERAARAVLDFLD